MDLMKHIKVVWALLDVFLVYVCHCLVKAITAVVIAIIIV